MSDEKIKGSCFCSVVEFEINGEPMVMIYCHCKDCQAWNNNAGWNSLGFSAWTSQEL